MSDLIGTEIGRYVIREHLGSGGMGEVYRAHDTQLHRQVALKRLGERYRHDEQHRRFILNEARRASSINDSSVAGVYDVLEHNGAFFIVMEFVDGVSLRERLSSPLPLQDFLFIAKQCARGLRAAHENNVVHGDLKPENIMVTNKTGDVKLCDFGLARVDSASGTDEGTTATLPSLTEGSVAGTPAYMAPEALAGGGASVRSDVFSLGVTFYELLSGKNPFRAGTVSATAQRVVTETPPPLERVAKVPKNVAAIVAKMMQKNPAERYQSAREVLVDLEKLESVDHKASQRTTLLALVALLVAAVAVGVLVYPSNKPVGSPSSAAVRTLVMLPFGTVGVTPSQKFEAAGLSETLNAALVKVSVGHNLQVLPASEVQRTHVKTSEDARKELGATLVLMASVQYFDKSVRVNCTLLDGESSRQLGADTVTVDSGDPFLLQDRIIEAVVGILGIKISPEQQAAIYHHGTRQPGAEEFYLQGRGYLLDYDRIQNLESAIDLFKRALESDPKYSLALAGLGEAYWRKYDTTKDKEFVAPARSACERAVTLGSQLAAPHQCLGMIYNGTGAYEKAVVEFNRALELDRTLDTAYVNLGVAYDHLKQKDKAEQIYQRAIDLKPRYWAAYGALGLYYQANAKYKQAEQMFLQVVRLAPDSYRGYSNLGVNYASQGRNAEAIEAFEKSMKIRPNYGAASNLGSLRIYEGHYAKGAEAFRQALSINANDFAVWGNLGVALHWAGKLDESASAYVEAEKRARDKLKLNPRDSAALIGLAEYNGALGSRGECISFLQQALQEDPENSKILYKAAVVYEFNLHRRDDALGSLRKAVERGYSWKEIDHSPSLAELRKDPRFAELRKAFPK